MSEKTRQEKWRHNTLRRRKHSMKVHLSPIDAASLNQLAVQLYLAHPHDPHNGIDGSRVHGVRFYPSPAEAVRHLIREWRKANGRPSKKFDEYRAELSEFWANEAVWRACNERSDPEKKPPPPWRWR